LPLNFVQVVQETPAGGPMMMPLAMGGSVKDLTDTKYLVIHGDDYSPSNQKSEIKITDSSGKEILPEKKDSGIYYNAPSGANLMLKLGFHLVEGEENVMTYDYEDGAFFNFRLPEGLTFEPLSGITVKDGSGTTIGTASISGNTLTVEFNANVEGQYGIWGNITINGTFKNIASGAPEETSFSLGSQTVVIERDTDDPPPAPGKVNLDKNGVFLPSGNIRWTVTVTPESDLCHRFLHGKKPDGFLAPDHCRNGYCQGHKFHFLHLPRRHGGKANRHLRDDPKPSYESRLRKVQKHRRALQKLYGHQSPESGEGADHRGGHSKRGRQRSARQRRPD